MYMTVGSRSSQGRHKSMPTSCGENGMCRFRRAAHAACTARLRKNVHCKKGSGLARQNVLLCCTTKPAIMRYYATSFERVALEQTYMLALATRACNPMFVWRGGGRYEEHVMTFKSLMRELLRRPNWAGHTTPTADAMLSLKRSLPTCMCPHVLQTPWQ